jgi:preprotein translocase subunit SecG
MPVFFVILHVVVCIALILIVLLQTGKGADMGAVFGGGGSNTLFGATGASTFLGKMTTVAAVVFMLTSLTLAYMAANRTSSSILEGQPPAQTQKTTTAPAQKGVQTETKAPATKATEQKPQPKPETQKAGEKEAPQKTQ